MELGGWLLAVGLAQSLLYVFLQGARSVVNMKIQRDARDMLFAHLSRLPPSFYATWRAGDLVTRLTDDAGQKTAWALCSGVFRTLEGLMVLAACLFLMWQIDPTLTLWVSLPLPLLAVAQGTLQRTLGDRYRAVQRSISGVNNELTTTFEGIRVVQAAGLTDAATARFDAAISAQRQAEIRAADAQQGIFLMYGHGWKMAAVALLMVGGARVMSGELTLGQFVSFEGFVMALVFPMFNLGQFVSSFMLVGVALERLDALMDTPAPAPVVDPLIPAGTGAALVGAVAEAGGARLLGPVDLVLAPGEQVAVVGEVASGKSTLLALLAGAWPPAAGRREVGGVDAARVEPGALRRALAYVPQSPVLLSASLRENILLGRDVSEATLARALEISRLAQDLAHLPKGLDTRVGERGVTLSGGQQQRAAIARALVGDPEILLLDDATAALDADTEAAFWAELEAALPNMTLVVVTHRPATIARCDRVLVLEGGQVVQEGQHADLIARAGVYQRIYGRWRAVETVASLGGSS
jgi:ATP-binding cassette subfamily B protein